jgi:hypothetical protein
MNIKIWIFVAVILLALIIGYFVGKSMVKPAEIAVVKNTSVETTEAAVAKPGINQAKTRAQSAIV